MKSSNECTMPIRDVLARGLGGEDQAPVPYVVVISGAGLGESARIHRPKTVIGRAETADICLPAPGISREHAQLLIQEDRVVVEDLSSRNGTYVNGERLAQSRVLEDGDKIGLAEIVLKFTYQDDVDAAFQQHMFDGARKDALTGAFKRAHFAERLEMEYRRWTNHGVPLSVLFFDIDFFKVINDTYGHQAGDLVLKEVAFAARGALRLQDMLARWGGEEFVVLCRGVGATIARGMAERLRVEVERSTVCWPRSTRIPVTVSVGIASTEVAGISGPDALIDAADRAMYAAKRAGRNRVQIASG